MLDFMMVTTKSAKRGTIEIYPKFKVRSSSDLMIRGRDFYAIWNEDTKLWSTDEDVALQLIDRELDNYVESHREGFGDNLVKVLHMWDSDSGSVDRWHKYVQKQMRDHYHVLDEKIIFANMETSKKDYASKRLPYPLEQGPMDAYEELMSTLYAPEERHKIEWAIGSVVAGESKNLQKFLVLYGSAGTGKSTVLNIVQDLFPGYYSVFDAKALGSSTNAFALEAFKSNPLVAIQHDGDLSRIEDNTRLNSLVSHELMTVNEKFKATYENRFNSFLFMGTNKPVKITDAKSGILRRLIDVTPSGNKLAPETYKKVVSQVKFELGAIAYHCKEVFLNDPGTYDNYIPTDMMGESNDFYNFVNEYYDTFKRQNGTTLKQAWELYNLYVDDAKVTYPLSKIKFKAELKNYFESFDERYMSEDGTHIWNYYYGFTFDKFIYSNGKLEPKPEILLEMDETESKFDELCKHCPAQYANESEKPIACWDGVTTSLKDLDTHKLHYVRVPENHIVIDFDLKDENGEKSYELNAKAASKFPSTYAELSKSGKGIHLHYIYTGGDPKQLSRIYGEDIEVKVFTGNSSLRRKLTRCNNLPIVEINSGLPLKTKGENMVNFEGIKSERGLRTFIQRNLNKEIHDATKPSIDFIYKKLEDCYNEGLKYDVTDMRPAILAFAAGSSHQSDYCIKLVSKMHFKSEEANEASSDYSSDLLVFYDVEVFPNLFLVNWKYEGPEHSVVRMINPKPEEIEELLRYKLVGFNCRRYDNHIMYARMMGYTNEQLFNLSQRIISGSSNCFFSEAYNLSYTDAYDFSSKKQSLKKFEIELGIHHQELGLPWDKPVPEEKWQQVAEYCDNDVIATEAVFNARKGDFTARQILADLAGMTPNDTTNSLTTRIIFGKERHPQEQFQYRFMGTDSFPFKETHDGYEDWDFFRDGKPCFQGYEFKDGKSSYRGEDDIGEGGYVYAEPGMYENVVTFDVASMHPSSIIAENLFGDTYTARFKEILDARIAIKHKDFDKAKTMLGGVMAKYLDNKDDAKALAQALKIAINSVYGLTSAKFENPFKDPRNIDNIVAKRGALFMVNLRHAVQEKGFTVVHIKTDSIKIANPTPEIQQFVMDYGKKYGYNFEIEHVFEKICLVNDAVYIAKLDKTDEDWLEDCEKVKKKAEETDKPYVEPTRWTATGTQFAIPYVFKTLFSKEKVEFDDLCETKSVSTSLYLDMNENLPDVTVQEKELENFIKQEELPFDYETWVDAKRAEIAIGHNYIFVGKVGAFVPIKPGCGGGLLMRESKDCLGFQKFVSATGAKGYRWKEAEVVRSLGSQDDIDMKYYQSLVDNAVATVSQYGDFEWFTSDNDEPSP